MSAGRTLRRSLPLALVVLFLGLAGYGIYTFLTFRPAAITIGPDTTLYFRDHPPLTTRVHEAIHRRQMRDKDLVGRIWNAVRYNFDYGYRLDEEAEAKAGEICLQIHRFSSELPAYTTARSRSQAAAYRAWAWERMGLRVPDRVGAKLEGGARCHEILAGVELDVPPGTALSDEDALRLATFRFLQSWGSTGREVAAWKARLELAGYVDPARWDLPTDIPPFGLIPLGDSLAPEPDTTLTARAAGEALHRLTYAGADRLYTQLQSPAVPWDWRPFPAAEQAEAWTGLPLDTWPDRLLSRALDGELDEEQLRWLESLAAHPIHAVFDTFAAAPDADVVGTRYRQPMQATWDRLALTEMGPIREVFHAQWGRAALHAQAGELEEAEAVLRRVVGGGLHLARNAPFEVDVLQALELIEEGLESLYRIQRAQGLDAPWVETLRDLSSQRWARGARVHLFSEDSRELYRAMPVLANDPGIPHAFKRFAYRQVVLTDVCLERRRDGLSRQEHGRWRSAVEVGLVRRGSDAELLRLMRQDVRELLSTSAVPPERICNPVTGVRPDARMAIMSAPLQQPDVRSADTD